MPKNSVYTMVKVMSQKVDDGFKNLKEDINEIKQHTGKINGCLRDNEMAIVKLDTELSTHLEEHKSGKKKKRRINFSLFRGG